MLQNAGQAHMLLSRSAVKKRPRRVKGQCVVPPSSSSVNPAQFSAQKNFTGNTKKKHVSVYMKILWMYLEDPVPTSPTRWLCLATVSGQKTCSWKHKTEVRSSAPAAIRWRSQRAAWRPLYFRPVRERTQTWDGWSGPGNWSVSAGRAVFHLLAGFYKLVDSHHSVSVTIHFLEGIKKKKKQKHGNVFNFKTWKRFKSFCRGEEAAIYDAPGRISPHAHRGSPLVQRVKCICPSCHTQRSLLPTSPAEQ